MGFNTKSFGTFVHQVRTASKMTVQEFANAAGITARQNLSRIEAGEILNPSFENIHGILRAINDLDLIKRCEIDLTDYSPEIIQLVGLYQKLDSGESVWISGEWGEGKSASVNVMKKYSVPDVELGLAMVDTASGYPALKEELQELWHEVGKNFSDPDSVDYSRIFHDQTKRTNTLFYKEMNRGLNLMASGKSLPQPYKFMTLFLRAIQMQVNGYGDKQSDEPPKVRRLQRDVSVDFV